MISVDRFSYSPAPFDVQGSKIDKDELTNEI
jgi:hypothetical protein